MVVAMIMHAHDVISWSGFWDSGGFVQRSDDSDSFSPTGFGLLLWACASKCY